MALLKLNRYQIHFSDNESHTCPSTAFPNLPTKDKYYTKNQINRLVNVAEKYHMTVVPEIDVPGHAKALVHRILHSAARTS